jgi:CheY-like chemotaxis protein
MEKESKIILLVEDNSIIALSEKRSLDELGYFVIIAHAGNQAITEIKNNRSIDLILMDIDLGKGLDGFEVARQILNLRDIPIVFLTSYMELEFIRKIDLLTSYGYVSKDLGVSVLDASIKMAFKLFASFEKEKNLHETLDATLAALPDMLLEVGMNGQCYNMHSPYSESRFWTDNLFEGKSISEIYPSNVAVIIMDAIIDANIKGFSLGKEFKLTTNAGIRWYEVSVARKGFSKEDPRFIILKRDITERIEAEQSRYKSEMQLRELIENIPGIVYSFSVKKGGLFYSSGVFDLSFGMIQYTQMIYQMLIILLKKQ